MASMQVNTRVLDQVMHSWMKLGKSVEPTVSLHIKVCANMQKISWHHLRKAVPQTKLVRSVTKKDRPDMQGLMAGERISNSDDGGAVGSLGES